MGALWGLAVRELALVKLAMGELARRKRERLSVLKSVEKGLKLLLPVL